MTRSTSIPPHAAYIGSCVWSWTGHEFVNGVYHSHENEQPVLLHAPPASSKTYSSIKQAAGFLKTGELPPITYLVKRFELYAQAEQLADRFDLTCEILPAPKRDCPCFKSSDLRHEPLAVELYEHGVAGSTLHQVLNLPCQGMCEYIRKLRAIDEDPTQYDVLIGHPLHANMSFVTNDRIVIFDEYPVDAFVTTFENPGPIVDRYLQDQSEVPFEDWQDLLVHRDSSAVPIVASKLCAASVTVQDLMDLSDDERYPRVAPVLVAAILTGTDLGNGIEYSRLNGRIVLYEAEKQAITVFNPPMLKESDPEQGLVAPWATVGFDGTPCLPLWNLLFTGNFRKRSVLSETQRREFEKSALGLTLYRIGQGLKPYNGRYVNPDKDAEILSEIQQRERQPPDLITTKNALDQYRAEEVTEFVGREAYYGNIKSSNRFAGTDVGCVFGAPHPGDDVVKRWCGLLNLPTDISGRGMKRDYGGNIQNAVYEHFVHDQVYQAVMRFVRGNSPATVYVNTETVEKWIYPDDILNWKPNSTPTKNQIIRIIHKESEVSTSEIANKVDVTPERVRQILDELEEEGQVEKVQPGRGPISAQWGWVGPNREN